MLEQIRKPILLVLLASLLLPGCAHYSKSARQQRAYERYVKKQSGIRYKQRAKIKTPRIPSAPAPSAPTISTGVSDAPLSVSSGQ